MEERQAIVRLKDGDLTGLEYLVNRYYFQAVHSAYLIVRDKSLAEDVVQTTFLNLVQKVEKFDLGFPFRPWFMKCVVNAAINALDGQGRLVSLADEPEDGCLATFERQFDTPLSPEEQAVNEETRQAVWQALGQLNPRQRAVVVMRYYLQFNENEMAQQLDEPKSSIKWWLRSAKARLRVLLHGKGFSPAISNHRRAPDEKRKESGNG